MKKSYNRYGHGGETETIDLTQQMREAKEVIGEAKWNALSEDDKVKLTEYLIMKGEVEGNDDDYEYKKGGGVNKKRFYEGESIYYKPITTKVLIDALPNHNKYADKELVIEEIEYDSPHSKAKVFVRSTGEKVPGYVFLNPKVVKQYSDKGKKPKVIHTQFEEEEFEYARGGRVTKNSKIKYWYIKTYPTDELGEEIRDTLTFRGLWAAMSQGLDVYNVLGVGDSVVRERVFEKLATMLGVDYNVVYDSWSGGKNLMPKEFADGGGVYLIDDARKPDIKSGHARYIVSVVNTEDQAKEYISLWGESGLSYEQMEDGKWAIRKSFADGGMMAHGGKTHTRNRKKTLEEKAMDAVGSSTWFQLDKETQAGVIAEMLSLGELPQRMAKGSKVAQDFTVTFELMDGKKVVEKYESQEAMDDGIANFYIMNDVKDAIVGAKPEEKVEVKAEVKEEKPKKKGLFDVEKAAPKVSKSKETAPVVHVSGLEKEIQRYDELKAVIKNAEAEKEVIGGLIKDVAKDKYLEVYEQQGKRPTSITIESGGAEINYTVLDKYKIVTPEKETVLKEYDGLLGTDYTFTFDNEILDKEGKNGEKIADIINDLIENSEDIPDDLKSKLVKITKKTGVKKGSIEKLLNYDNPAEILQVIEAVEMLK